MGVTPEYIYMLRSTDAYKEYFANRRRDHTEMVSERILDKAQGLAELSLDVMTERIKEERDKINLEGVRNTAALALQACGFTDRKGNGRPQGPTVNINVVGSDVLESARQKHRQLSAANARPVDEGDAIDGEAEEVLPAAS